MSTGTLAVFLIFSIPIIAIFMGGLREIVKIQSQQGGLDTATQELESTVDALAERLSEVEEERNILERRVQNLETIVTSDVWDDHVDADLALDEASEGELELPDETESAADETSRLARRIRSK